MGITYNSHNVASMRITGPAGIRGIGFNRLQFSISFDIAPTPGRSILIGNPLCSISCSSSSVATFSPLCHAITESNWFARTNEHPQTSNFTVKLDLAREQLIALEQIRSGGSLFFRFDFQVLFHGQDGPQPAVESLHHEVNLSSWTKVLNDLGACDTLLLGIELPAANIPEALENSVQQIREAHSDLLAGRYDSVVSRVRLCLEGIDKHINSDAIANSALIKLASHDTRTTMSKGERANAVRAAVRHYAHLAHHVDKMGISETFSRHEALFILSSAAATLWDAIGRFPSDAQS